MTPSTRCIESPALIRGSCISFEAMVSRERAIAEHAALFPTVLRRAKREGLLDRDIGKACGASEAEVREARHRGGVAPSYHRVDTCAGEFESFTPYLYSTYESGCEAAPSQRRKVMILGSGANRIGQGIEFDYCCCHAAYALRDAGYETIMVNCNPETVSTDYDTADRLYFEPLTLEHVLSIAEVEKPEGVIVQLGGQTPLALAADLEAAGVSRAWNEPPRDRPGGRPGTLRCAPTFDGDSATRPRLRSQH